jgi:hypothetical protein
MGTLHGRALLATPLVGLADLVCGAPRGGCGPEEGEPAPRVLIPRHGAFTVHRGREAVVAAPPLALVLAGGEGYRVSHPADGGDACLVLAPRPDLLEEALGDARHRHGGLRPPTQLALRRLAARPDTGGMLPSSPLTAPTPISRTPSTPSAASSARGRWTSPSCSPTARGRTGPRSGTSAGRCAAAPSKTCSSSPPPTSRRPPGARRCAATTRAWIAGT